MSTTNRLECSVRRKLEEEQLQHKTMPRREVTFSPGEYYHVYNRGVDGRAITNSRFDSDRFVLGLVLFNNRKPIGSIFANTTARAEPLTRSMNTGTDRLVDIICYCLNPNHFHLVVREYCEGGVVHYMKRVAGGYASYFNERYGRAGPLYEGRFKAKHVATNEYLQWLSAYVNLNDQVHRLADSTQPLVRSSMSEYRVPQSAVVSRPDVVLDQFVQGVERRSQAYESFAHAALMEMRQRKDDVRLLSELGSE